MSPELIATLIKLAPTIIVLVELLICLLAGFLQGFRKSSILFLNFVIALAIGIGSFFAVTTILHTADLNQYLVLIGGSFGLDFSEAHSIVDAVGVVLDQYLSDYAFIAQIPEYQQIITAISGVVINLVMGLICLVIIPIIVRFILYIFYLIFNREGRYKKQIIEEGGVYKRQRLLGLLVGLGRGAILATLTISLLSSVYFIAAGGEFEEYEETPTLELLDSLGLDQYGIDASLIYEALKESRSTGVGAIFDVLKVNGESLDYFAFDLLFSSEFDSVKGYGKAQLNLRKELANLVGLVEDVLESNVINISTDGQTSIIINTEAYDEELKGKIRKANH